MSNLPSGASIWARVGVAVVAAVAIAACGISPDSGVTHIPAGDLGDVTATTTTTTTTTTTVVPETSPATSSTPSLPPETTTTSTTTTTIESVQSWPVSVYYVPRGDDTTVKKVVVQQAEPTVNDVLRLLSSPLPRVTELDLSTAVTPDLVASYDIQRRQTNLDLDPTAFERMTEAKLRQAIAQLVLTLTTFVPAEQGAIGAVSFSVGGEPISVIIPGEGQTDPGEPVVFGDFRSWIDPPLDGPATTTAPPTTTPTTDPPPIPETSAPATMPPT